jgi:hypothetical protein
LDGPIKSDLDPGVKEPIGFKTVNKDAWAARLTFAFLSFSPFLTQDIFGLAASSHIMRESRGGSR